MPVPALDFVTPDYEPRVFGEDFLKIDRQAAELSHPYKAIMAAVLVEAGAPVTTSALRIELIDRVGSDMGVPSSDSFLHLGRRLGAYNIAAIGGARENELLATDTTATLAPLLGFYAASCLVDANPALIFGAPQGESSQLKRFGIFRELTQSLSMGTLFDVLSSKEANPSAKDLKYRRDTLQRLGDIGLFDIESGRNPTRYRLVAPELRLYATTTEFRVAVKNILEQQDAYDIDQISMALDAQGVDHTRYQIAQYMGDLVKRGHVEYLEGKPKDGLFRISEADADADSLVAFVDGLDLFASSHTGFAERYGPQTNRLLTSGSDLRAYVEIHEPGLNEYSSEKLENIRASVTAEWSGVSSIAERYAEAGEDTESRRLLTAPTARRYLRVLVRSGDIEVQRSLRGLLYSRKV